MMRKDCESECYGPVSLDYLDVYTTWALLKSGAPAGTLEIYSYHKRFLSDILGLVASVL